MVIAMKIQPTYTLTEVVRMSGWRYRSVLRRVNAGLLPSVVNEFDEERREVVQVLRDPERHANLQVLVPVEPADIFIKWAKARADGTGTSSSADIVPSKQEKADILKCADYVKSHSGEKYVSRQEVLLKWKGKRNNMNAASKIRYVLDMPENRILYPKRPGR
jgi:hypothetical protein